MNQSKHVVVGATISMMTLILQMLAAFVKVRVILIHYGHEYYSIFQSSNGIFSYLILIESGFSVAYLLKMYEPYAKKNYKHLQALYVGLEKMLTKVASIMLMGVIAITVFYPMVIADNSLGRLELSLLIGLCGIKFVLPYFFTVAKKQMLNVVEKSYLTSIIDSFINLITDIIIIAIAYFTNWSFLIIVLAQVLMLIPSIIVYSVIISYYKKSFSFEKKIVPSYEPSAMTKDIMAQKIAYLADNNIDQIILSTRDLLQTTVYTSFNSVVSYPVSMINQLIASFRGHLGVRLADNVNDSYSLFRRLLSVNYYIASVISCVFVFQVQDFIRLWIGETYSTQDVTVILFSLLLFRKCAENTVTIAREGRDLYKESKNYAIMAAFVNLVLSLILVQFFEIKGLVIATLVADLFVLDFNNYRLVFRKIFNKSIDIWKELTPFLICFVCVCYLKYNTSLGNTENLTWTYFISKSFIVFLLTAFSICALYMLCSDHFRKTISQVLPSRLKKKN